MNSVSPQIRITNTQDRLPLTKKLPDVKGLFSFIKDIILALVIPVALLIAWEVLSRAGIIRPSILPPPSAILLTLMDMLEVRRDLSSSRGQYSPGSPGLCPGGYPGNYHRYLDGFVQTN
jgi:hypothetical protein